jgi:hypothetical protein
MPAGTAFAQSAAARQLGPDRTGQIYQATSFAMAIPDQPTKLSVLNAIRTRVGDGVYFGAVGPLLADQQQMQSVFTGYQSVAGAFAGALTSTGLDRWLPQSKPAPALALDVAGWVRKRLATPAQVSDALGMLLDGPVTAECALNQLAQDGFVDTINGH